MGGFSTVTPSGGSVNVTSVAQAVWSYTPRSLTEMQNLVSAIQNNDPSLLSTPSDILYVPVPYYAGQVTADQAAAFIDNLIRNYNMPGAIANFITNYMYGPWTPNTVGAFLSSQNMSQTSVTLLLAYAGATQMGQALSYLSGNYTNVVNAFNIVNPSSGAAVMANVSASQAATILSHPLMSVTQAAMILGNSAIPATQGASIINAMAANTAAIILNIAAGYNVTQVAMELNLVSTSQLVNITANPNMSYTSLAAILSNAGLSANNAQLILYQLAQNYYYNLWTNTVTANAGSTTISTNVTVVSPLYSQNLTIASGVTITCGTQTCFFVAQSFNNYGTVVSQKGAAGASPINGGGGGGTGGGGIVIVAVTATLGTLDVSGGNGSNGTSPTTTASPGGGGGGGVFYIVTGVAVPTGGSSPNTKGGTNGGAGGAGDNEPGGAGGGATVYSFSSPNDMVAYILQGLSDWWLSNVVGKAPSTTTQLVFMYGSGGGGGGVASGYGSGGGGGGGAGEVVAYGYNILSGNVKAVGGIAGTGYGSSYSGAGGGGGGLVFIFYGATSGTVTATLAGGAGSAGSTSSLNGLAGANGTLYIAAVTVNG